MKRHSTARVRPLPLVAVLVAFCAGVFVDWALRTYGPPQPAGSVDAPKVIGPDVRLKPDATMGTKGTDDKNVASGFPGAPKPHGGEGGSRTSPTATTGTSGLRLPIDGMNVEPLKGDFLDARAGHRHEAVDILSPRNTPIHAVQDGTIAKLFSSKLGGLTIYQFDPTGRLCYYYAHLERYQNNLHEGDAVAKGQVIGYVGTSGNAPPNTPHLHFAVFELGDDRRWWKGTAIDPYPLLKAAGG